MTTPLDYSDQPVRRGARGWLWALAALSLLGGAFWFLVPVKTTARSAQARVVAARSDLATLDVALVAFNADVGRFPTALEGLGALTQPPTALPAWRGPYLKLNRPPTDPWSNPYVYTPPTGSSPPLVLSAGPDATVGTADDIAAQVR